MFSAVDIEYNFRTMVQQVTSYYSDAFAVSKKKTKTKKKAIYSKQRKLNGKQRRQF